MDNTYEKRNEIIHAAVYLFSNKGFSSTSVQDIASHCNISKATIYKLFKSKEDILIEIIKHLNKQILLLVENIDLNPEMSSTEKFEEKLYIFFEHLSSKKDFTVMIYQDESVAKSEDFQKISVENKFFLLNWFKDMILDTYGEEIKPHVWDIVISLTGMIKELSRIFIMKEFIIKDHREISKYLVNTVSVLSKNCLDKEPLIPYDSICSFDINKDKFFNNEFLIEESKLLIEKLKSTTKNSKTIANKEEVFEVIETIIEEKNKKNQRKYIIEGLFLYLSKYTELEKDALFLKQLYKKLSSK